MLRAAKTCTIALALSASTLTVVAAAPAQAAPGFANCTALHRTYRYGVARTAQAANRQVRTGHYRPAVRPAVYRANASKDADRDGTACEVGR
jgi:hypothetical protein